MFVVDVTGSGRVSAGTLEGLDSPSGRALEDAPAAFWEAIAAAVRVQR